MGKLHGIPMGCDACYTNHADADQNDLENLPVGGIGEFGAEQWQLDEAAITGQPFDGDGNYHQGQQAWLRIQEAINKLQL